MARAINYAKLRNRPRSEPLVSKDLERRFKRDARILKVRVEKGWKNPQAYLHGQCRSLSDEEKAAIAAKNGWAVKEKRS
jgi:hypothetical protein